MMMSQESMHTLQVWGFATAGLGVRHRASAEAAVLSSISYLGIPHSISFEKRSTLRKIEAKSHSLNRFHVSHVFISMIVTPIVQTRKSKLREVK